MGYLFNAEPQCLFLAQSQRRVLAPLGGLIIGLSGVPGRKACRQQPELEYRVNSARHVEEDAGTGAGAAEDLQHSPDQLGPLVHAE